MGENFLEIPPKRGKEPDVLQTFMNIHTVTGAIGKSICSASIQNIQNQLGKHDFSCV